MPAHCATERRSQGTIRLRRIFGIGDASPNADDAWAAHCAQARGGSLLLAFQIGSRGSRRQHPLQDRPPTLQAFRSVLSRTRSVSTHGLHGSRSYLRRHGVQFRGVHIYYHKTAFTVHPKNRWPGGRLNTKAQTPPLLGTDPVKPLILLGLLICKTRFSTTKVLQSYDKSPKHL